MGEWSLWDAVLRLWSEWVDSSLRDSSITRQGLTRPFLEDIVCHLAQRYKIRETAYSSPTPNFRFQGLTMKREGTFTVLFLSCSVLRHVQMGSYSDYTRLDFGPSTEWDL